MGGGIIEGLGAAEQAGRVIVRITNLFSKWGAGIGESIFNWNIFGARKNQAESATLFTDTQKRGLRVQNNSAVVREGKSNGNVHAFIQSNPTFISDSAAGAGDRQDIQAAADGGGASWWQFWKWGKGSSETAVAFYTPPNRVFGGGGGAPAAQPSAYAPAAAAPTLFFTTADAGSAPGAPDPARLAALDAASGLAGIVSPSNGESRNTALGFRSPSPAERQIT